MINTVHKNSVVNMIKGVKEKNLIEKQTEKKDFLLIDNSYLKKLENFASIYNADMDKKNRLAGFLCQSRKEKKQERKKRFILNTAELKFA